MKLEKTYKLEYRKIKQKLSQRKRNNGELNIQNASQPIKITIT